MKNKRLISLLVACLIVFGFSIAKADTGLRGYNAETFRPSIDGTGVVNTRGSHSLEKWQSTGALLLNANRNYVSGRSLVPQNGLNPVNLNINGDFMYAIGLPLGFTTGLDIPVYFYQRGINIALGTGEFKETVRGDIRWLVKWEALEDGTYPIGLALTSELFIPTGKRGYFTGNDSVSEEFRLILDKTWETLYIGANVGYLLAKRLYYTPTAFHDDEMVYSFGLGFPFKASGWSAFTEVSGSVLLDDRAKRTMPLEMLGGFKKEFCNGWQATMGFGASIPEIHTVGQPNYRFYGGLRYTYQKKDKYVSKVQSAPAPLREVVNFSTGSSRLNAEQLAGLDKIADSLKSNSALSVTIAGYTDAVGDTPYNVKLSRMRAQSVENYLVRDCSVDRSQVQIDWYGASHPVAPNDTDTGKAQNRRAEINTVALDIL